MPPLLVILCYLLALSTAKIQHVVLFGDSFTDQSRQHSIANGTFPGKDYQEVFPPLDYAADGGVQWPRYLGLYGGFTIWNYAVGGAVCSNELTPLYGYPDVANGQQAWFIEDHIENEKLTLDPASFVVIVYIGTNDVGIRSFITDSQAANISLSDLADCQLNAIRSLYRLGTRQFILNSLIPLHLTRLYSNSSLPTIYWPEEHDGNGWNKRMFNIVNSLNRILRDGVAQLQMEFGHTGKVEYFDNYQFFLEMYDNPAEFFNGTIPPDVVGHCHQCPVPTDPSQCGIGDCTLDERDSYMWWDELHPSEQTGRDLAAEMVRKIAGHSRF